MNLPSIEEKTWNEYLPVRL